ncbi:intermembrane transport protein PqiB [Deefgea sp. CFH1-16]|uniref:PqiB family protein n=1 Tax=Deefgea sp. CFH1-16 TaxID=2675457 RepID=UPI0015F5C4BF|nr:MlaD family protein [Deefgea sp. CFH1-16]MBM5573058.1 MCE family protein [Deefgea sp. CFH1-16]
MTESHNTPAADDINDGSIAQAKIKPKRKRPTLIWLIPFIAALAASWIGVQAILNKGPTITIEFNSADGLESGKTKVKYKDVVIGTVSNVTLSQDHQRVKVTAEMTHGSDNLLGEQSRFWVVRPLISGGTVSGLGTLLSGSYIALDPTSKPDSKRFFTGLETQPVITSNQPGREFTLKAQNMGSISNGTPIFFRRLQVGEVTSFKLDPSGEFISVSIFVHAPYDQFVTDNSRFWHASGFDVALNSNGLSIETQSLASVVIGGLAFQSPPGEDPGAVAKAGSRFLLADNKAAAMKSNDSYKLPFVIHFKDSVRGLAVGAAVDFRGIQVGEVQSIKLVLAKNKSDIELPITIAIYPDRFRNLQTDDNQALSVADQKKIINRLVENGMRAQMRTSNLITGQLYIALDYVPNAKKARINWASNPPQMPSVNSSLNEIQNRIASIVKKIDQIPLQSIGQNTDQTLKKLQETLTSSNALIHKIDQELLPEAKGTLKSAEGAFKQVQTTLQPESPVQQNLDQTLQELSKAAQSLRALSDYLNRHPEALIQGRKADQP